MGCFSLVSLWNTEFLLPSLSEIPSNICKKKESPWRTSEKYYTTVYGNTAQPNYSVDTYNFSGTKKKKKRKIRKLYLHISELGYRKSKLLCWFWKVDFEVILVIHILVIILIISPTSSHSLSKVWRCWDHGKKFQQIMFWLNHKTWQLWICLLSM